MPLKRGGGEGSRSNSGLWGLAFTSSQSHAGFRRTTGHHGVWRGAVCSPTRVTSPSISAYPSAPPPPPAPQADATLLSVSTNSFSSFLFAQSLHTTTPLNSGQPALYQ